jgi:hypothetical protein
MLFAQMGDTHAGFAFPAPHELRIETLPDVSWAAPVPSPVPPDSGAQEKATAVVVDAPGEESVLLGLALAARGYRPVPAYNVCTGLQEVIPQKAIMRRLVEGAAIFERQSLPPAAPPAFLLDSNRMSPTQLLRPGLFDNRWKVFPQDFPSARFLREQGIGGILLVQRGRRQPQEDLAHVLRRWQEAGLAFNGKDLNDGNQPAPLIVTAPPRYRSMWYRLLELFGLRRNELGGFGAVVPEPSKG